MEVFPKETGCWTTDDFNNISPQAKKYLGGKVFESEPNIINAKFIISDKYNLKILYAWWVNDVNFGRTPFLTGLKFMEYEGLPVVSVEDLAPRYVDGGYEISFKLRVIGDSSDITGGMGLDTLGAWEFNNSLADNSSRNNDMELAPYGSGDAQYNTQADGAVTYSHHQTTGTDPLPYLATVLSTDIPDNYILKTRFSCFGIDDGGQATVVGVEAGASSYDNDTGGVGLRVYGVGGTEYKIGIVFYDGDDFKSFFSLNTFNIEAFAEVEVLTAEDSIALYINGEETNTYTFVTGLTESANPDTKNRITIAHDVRGDPPSIFNSFSLLEIDYVRIEKT